MNPIVAQQEDFYQKSKPFDYKTSIAGKLENDYIENVEIVVPLKHLSNFWKTLDVPLINCSTKNCVITSKAIMDIDYDADPAMVAINNPTNATFKKTDKTFYVPDVTLSAQYDNKHLE